MASKASDISKHVGFAETSEVLNSTSDLSSKGDSAEKQSASLETLDADSNVDCSTTTTTEDEEEVVESQSKETKKGHRKKPSSSSLGPNQALEQLDLEFTRWREAVVMVCLLFYVSDLILDGLVLHTFVLADNIRQAWFMGFCMLLPNLYAGYKSLQWYLKAFDRRQRDGMADPKVWFLRIIFFPISLVLRYYNVLKRGYDSRKAASKGDKARQRRFMVKFVEESAEVAMLRLFIIFLEDAPICVLNLVYVINTPSEEIEKVGYSVGVVVAKLSCSITLGVLHYASLTKLAYHANKFTVANSRGKKVVPPSNILNSRASRRGLRQQKSLYREGSNEPHTAAPTLQEFHKRTSLSPVAHVLLYAWQFSTIGSRLLCYGLFTSVFLLYVLVLATIRWLLNFFYILFDVPNMSLANCAAFGGVYLFTFVSASTDEQYLRLALYYAANVIEASIAGSVWWIYMARNDYHVMAFVLLIVGTVTSFILMLMYYAFGHPNRHNTWGCKLFRRHFHREEITNL